MNNDILKTIDQTQCCDPVIDDVLNQAKAEIERLQAALKEIASYGCPCPGNEIARRALEGK